MEICLLWARVCAHTRVCVHVSFALRLKGFLAVDDEERERKTEEEEWSILLYSNIQQDWMGRIPFGRRVKDKLFSLAFRGHTLHLHAVYTRHDTHEHKPSTRARASELLPSAVKHATPATRRPNVKAALRWRLGTLGNYSSEGIGAQQRQSFTMKYCWSFSFGDTSPVAAPAGLGLVLLFYGSSVLGFFNYKLFSFSSSLLLGFSHYKGSLFL